MLQLGASEIRFAVLGAKAGGSVSGESPLPGRSNYLVGSDPAQWKTGVPQFAKVRIHDTVPGMDTVLYGRQDRLEYDLVLQPGYDSDALGVRFEGQSGLSVDAEGDLVIETAAGPVRHKRPEAWQDGKDGKTEVAARYEIAGAGEVRIRLGQYDRSRPLTIDPVIVYGTAVPVTPRALAADASGNVYVAGAASYSAYPATTPGAFDTTANDAFIFKLSADGRAILYATYLGGSGTDRITAVKVDTGGNLYIAGWTTSSNFPLAGGAVNTQVVNSTNTFVSKLNPSGSGLIYSGIIGNLTYYYYDGPDVITLGVEASGNAYVTGIPTVNFQATAGALQTANAGGYDAAILKLDAGGRRVWATFLGGPGDDYPRAIAVDSAGYPYLTGSTSTGFPTTVGAYRAASTSQEAFAVKLSPAGNQLVYSTLLGPGTGKGIAVDASGQAHIAGETSSTSFPTTPGAFLTTPEGSCYPCMTVVKLNAAGSGALYATYLGADSYYFQTAIGIALDTQGRSVVGGTTSSANFPVTPGSLLTAMNSTQFFVSVFDQSGASLVYSTTASETSTYMTAFGLDPSGNAYLAGSSSAAWFPITSGVAWPTWPNYVGGVLAKVNLSDPTYCAFTVSPGSESFPATGGAGSFSITGSEGCPYRVTNNGSYYVTVTSGSHGIGNGTVSYSVEPTGSGYAARSFTMQVGTAVYTINQAAGTCTDPVFSVPSLSYTTAGGLQNLQMTIPYNCSWTAKSLVPWLMVTDGASGSQSGTITIYANSNSFAARTGQLVIAGKTINVTQAGGSCTLSLPVTQATLGAAAGTGALTMTTSASNCAWNAWSMAPWIKLGVSAGTGSAMIPFTVAVNPTMVPRTGSILVDGQTFTVTQAAGVNITVQEYTISTIAGTGSPGSLGDGGLATAAGLYAPTGLAFDASGNLLVAERYGNRIRKITPDGTITTIAGGGSDTGENVLATSAMLNNPWGIVVASSGDVLVSEYNGNRVRKFTPGGLIATVAGDPNALALGDGGPAVNASLLGPMGVAFKGGNLLISDGSHYRIREVGAGNVINTIAGTGSNGYSGDGASALSAALGIPSGIAVDAAGNIVFADGTHRVRKIDTAGIISTLAGTGSSSFSGDGGPAIAAGLNYPLGVAFDLAGNLLIVEGSRVRRIDSQGVIRTIAGNGNSSSSGDGGPATSAGLYSPTHIVADQVGNLYVSEHYGYRIRKLTPVPSFCTYTVGSLGPNAQPAAGLQAVFPVSTNAGCGWNTVMGSSWIRATSGTTGSGNGSVTIVVDPNPSKQPRTGTFSIAGQRITITQAGMVTEALRFVPVSPCRIADTRNPAGPFGGPAIAAGGIRNFPVLSSACNIPATAQAYSLNVTVAPYGMLGYLSIWPTGQPRPVVSTLNSYDGRVKANAALVPAGTNGAVSVFVTHATDVILDINGYFVPANTVGALGFNPVTPCRVMDTRGDYGGLFLSSGQTLHIPVPQTCGLPWDASAYSLNFTVVPHMPLGYITTWPTGTPRPLASTLNALTGQITANAAIVPAGTGGSIDVFASHATDLIVDVNGYFSESGGLSFYGLTPCRIADTRSPAGPFGGPSLLGARAFTVSASGCAAPAASVYSVNATVVPSGLLGYLTLWAQGAAQPTVSTLNSLDGSIVSNAALVPATNGSISTYATHATELLLDINGYFAP